MPSTIYLSPVFVTMDQLNSGAPGVVSPGNSQEKLLIWGGPEGATFLKIVEEIMRHSSQVLTCI